MTLSDITNYHDQLSPVNTPVKKKARHDESLEVAAEAVPLLMSTAEVAAEPVVEDMATKLTEDESVAEVLVQPPTDEAPTRRLFEAKKAEIEAEQRARC